MDQKTDIIGLSQTLSRSELEMTCSISKKEILKKIIKENGSCMWILDEYSGQDICHLCPFNTLKKKDKFNFFCCYEAVNGTAHPTETEADKKYKDTAIQLLVDMVVEEEILGKDPEEFGDLDG